jgi:nucleoside-triphosphatase
MSVLLLSGVPGVGKTTLIRKLPALLPQWRFGGFYTQEIRAGGERLGFRIATFDGAERVMAHVSFPGPRRAGKYGVDVAAIDALACAALSPAPVPDAYLIDEIGKMECMSREFVAAMRALFATSYPIVATIALRGGGFIAQTKALPSAELLQVTRENRDRLPQAVAAWLTEPRKRP